MNDVKKLAIEVDDLNDNVEEILPKNEREYRKLAPEVQKVLSHVLVLGGKKENLQNQYSNITANSNDAIKAVNAYAEIDNGVEIARNNSNVGHNAANKALQLTKGMSERAAKSHKESSELNHEGHEALSNVQLELSPSLTKATDDVNNIKQDLKTLNERLNSINGSVDAIKVAPLTDTWEEITTGAGDSNSLVKNQRRFSNRYLRSFQQRLTCRQRSRKKLKTQTRTFRKP